MFLVFRLSSNEKKILNTIFWIDGIDFVHLPVLIYTTFDAHVPKYRWDDEQNYEWYIKKNMDKKERDKYVIIIINNFVWKLSNILIT